MGEKNETKNTYSIHIAEAVERFQLLEVHVCAPSAWRLATAAQAFAGAGCGGDSSPILGVVEAPFCSSTCFASICAFSGEQHARELCAIVHRIAVIILQS